MHQYRDRRQQMKTSCIRRCAQAIITAALCCVPASCGAQHSGPARPDAYSQQTQGQRSAKADKRKAEERDRAAARAQYNAQAAQINGSNRKNLTGNLTFRETPSGYSQQVPESQRGSVEKVSYTATYQGKTYNKSALVYLPAGYGTNTWQKYNVMYILHGYGGGFTAYLGGEGRNSTAEIKLLLDHMVADKIINPAIFVFPEYYPDRSFKTDSYITDGPLVKAFVRDEFTKALVPAVESRYRTYLQATDDAELKASRAHRAFGGFSMGGAAAWYAFQYGLAYAQYFLPAAQSSWALYPHGGLTDPDGTARALRDAAAAQGIGKDGFTIAGGSGTADITSLYMRRQIDSMRRYPGTFTAANLEFGVAAGAGHTREALVNVLYNNLPFMFVNTDPK